MRPQGVAGSAFVTGAIGALPISRRQLEHWATFFEAPSAAVLAMFDDPDATDSSSRRGD